MESEQQRVNRELLELLNELRVALPMSIRTETPLLEATGVSKRFGSVQALQDVDFVLYSGEVVGLVGDVEDKPLAGAVEAVERLRAAGFALCLVTNTTSRSRAATLEKLRGLGFQATPEELVTPAALAVRHCVEHDLERVSLFMNDEVKEDFAPLDEDDEHPRAVIVGDMGDRFGYSTLNQAFRRLMDGAELVALQKNRYWLRENGLSLDVGPFVAALEYATGRDAYVVGKPAPGFFREVLAGLGLPPEAVAMVGDDVETDIGGALDAGLSAILVRTGKYREDAVRASGIEPTATVDSIADVPGLLGV